jgi:hypothetical protein
VTQEDCAARIEIANVMARCALAGDARKGDAYSDCFTLDGVLEVQGRRAEGREALLNYIEVRKAANEAGSEVVRSARSFVSHHLTSSRIELVSATLAKGRTYFVVITAAGLDHSGYYDDEFRRMSDEWLISYRRPRTLWISPQSIMASIRREEHAKGRPQDITSSTGFIESRQAGTENV